MLWLLPNLWVIHKINQSCMAGCLGCTHPAMAHHHHRISRYFPITTFFYKLSTNTNFLQRFIHWYLTHVHWICFLMLFFQILVCTVFITYFLLLAMRMHFLFCAAHALYCGPTVSNCFDWKLSKFWFHSNNSNNMIFQLFTSHLLWAALQQNTQLRWKGKNTKAVSLY